MFWNLWLQIAVEWPHDCCHVLLPCVWRHAAFPRDAGKRIVRLHQGSLLLEWPQDCCHVLLPCMSRHAGLPRDAGKRIVMAASRFLAAAALCVIFLSFAAWVRNVIADGENFLPDLLREVP